MGTDEARDLVMKAELVIARYNGATIETLRSVAAAAEASREDLTQLLESLRQDSHQQTQRVWSTATRPALLAEAGRYATVKKTTPKDELVDQIVEGVWEQRAAPGASEATTLQRIYDEAIRVIGSLQSMVAQLEEWPARLRTELEEINAGAAKRIAKLNAAEDPAAELFSLVESKGNDLMRSSALRTHISQALRHLDTGVSLERAVVVAIQRVTQQPGNLAVTNLRCDMHGIAVAQELKAGVDMIDMMAGFLPISVIELVGR